MQGQNLPRCAKCDVPGRMLSLGMYVGLMVLCSSPIIGQGRIYTEPPEKVWAETAGIDRIVWHIEQPEVRRDVTVYPQIQIRAEDTVTLSGGGCVQIGGRNHTWKRYLNPSGGTGDLYHGMIQLGNSRGLGMVPILNVLSRPLTHSAFVPGEEPACPVCSVPLVLGYSDNDYDDNGYYHLDDENETECLGIGLAWLTVTIQRGYQSYENDLFSVQYRLGDHIDGTLRNRTDRPLPCATFEFSPFVSARAGNGSWDYTETNLQPSETRSFSYERIANTKPDGIFLAVVKHYCEWQESPESRYGFYREPGFDRNGGNYNHFEMDDPNIDRCEQACNDNRRCKAYTYVNPGVMSARAVCWLKDSVPEPLPNPNMTSGTSRWINRIRP